MCHSAFYYVFSNKEHSTSICSLSYLRPSWKDIELDQIWPSFWRTEEPQRPYFYTPPQRPLLSFLPLEIPAKKNHIEMIRKIMFWMMENMGTGVTEVGAVVDAMAKRHTTQTASLSISIGGTKSCYSMRVVLFCQKPMVPRDIEIWCHPEINGPYWFATAGTHEQICHDPK